MLCDLIKPRVTELGKIKIGCKGEERGAPDNRWRLPMKIDHFLITTMNRDKGGQLIVDTALMEQLARDGYADDDGKIRRIPIQLLSDDLEDVMQAAYVYYRGKKCAMRSDGKTETWFVNPKKLDDWLKVPVERPFSPETPKWADAKGNPLVKLHTTLNVVIRSAGSKFGGVHRFRTTSRISAEQLYGCMTHLTHLTGGVLAGLPLEMVVRPMQVSPDGKTTTVYVVHVQLAGPDIKQIQQQALDQMKFRLTYQREMGKSLIEYKRLLASPGHESDPREVADVNEEFQPETVTERVEPDVSDPLMDADGEQPEAPPAPEPEQDAPPSAETLFDGGSVDEESDDPMGKYLEYADKIEAACRRLAPQQEIDELFGEAAVDGLRGAALQQLRDKAVFLQKTNGGVKGRKRQTA